MLPKFKSFRKLLLSQKTTKYANSKHIILDGDSLNMEKLSCISSGSHAIKLCEKSISKINSSRKIVDSIIRENKPVYGFNTGFGQFSKICIPNSNLEQLQYNLIRSHATGTGNLLPSEQSIRTAVLRVNTLARGHSGISLDTLDTLIQIINSKIVPFCPSQGTVGASGDLVPLAHIALGVIGEGLLLNPRSQQYEDALKVLNDFNIKPATLKAREGLSLINGTQFMTAIGSTALEKSINLIRTVNAISALSFTALKGHPTEFDERIGLIRPHPGQMAIAEVMRKLIPYGSILENANDCQSPYSLRCIPQVHGPVLETIIYVKELLEREMNSTTDNPLVFDYGTPNIISNGNFHGEYVAKALDMLAIYVHELGNISYPRIMRLLNKSKNNDLNTFLTYEEGLHSGMMTYENLAAALVSENKVHCTPASIDSLSTCADKEDHVSMGGYAARKSMTVVENVGKILTVELMAATKAITMRMENEPGFKLPKYLKNLHEKVMSISPPFKQDRYSKPEYDKIYELVMSGILWDDLLSEIDCEDKNSVFEIENKTKNKKKVDENLNLPQNFCGKSENAKDRIENSSRDKIFLISPIPSNEKDQIAYTKERIGQIQIGQISEIFIKSKNPITYEILKEKLKLKRHSTKNCFAILDLSQDDIGSRANFGKGHTSQLYPFKPFLEKLSNHPINSLNSHYINSILLLGSLDLSDLLSQCQNKNPNIPEERSLLTSCVKEVDKRTQAICDTIFETGSNVICLNGDNNNTLSLIGSLQRVYKKKVILIYLDIHSDCRNSSDGPHSGTWVTQSYENNWIEKSFLIGFSELHNNEACVENLIKYDVQFKDFTCQNIQSRQKTLKSSVEDIIKCVKENYKDSPVVLCIDGDTVSGMPASAGNTAVGFDHQYVYPAIYKLAKKLKIQALHVAELKPSLDPSKESAVGEFLMQVVYLFLKGSLASKKF
jgi:histidine ammonia-lyase